VFEQAPEGLATDTERVLNQLPETGAGISDEFVGRGKKGCKDLFRRRRREVKPGRSKSGVVPLHWLMPLMFCLPTFLFVFLYWVDR